MSAILRSLLFSTLAVLGLVVACPPVATAAPASRPSVTSVAPRTGPAAGGTRVVISGRRFTGATAVHFGTRRATNVRVLSATRVSALAPAGTGTVSVRVTTPRGISGNTPADDFTYLPAPVVTSISPPSGPEAGGTTVTVSGRRFSGATAVRFGATHAVSFSVVSATRITAVAPAGTGTVRVRVTTRGGTSADTSADDYSYAAPGVEVVWAQLFFPATMIGPGTVYARVSAPGTEQPGALGAISAQVGHGPVGSSPSTASGWEWVDATFNLDVEFSDNDEYGAELSPSGIGTFDYVYRFSGDGGATWLYADLDGPVAAGAVPVHPGVLVNMP